MPTRDCEHGKLARSCDICEMEDGVEYLRRTVKKLFSRNLQLAIENSTLRSENAELGKFKECNKDPGPDFHPRSNCREPHYHKEGE